MFPQNKTFKCVGRNALVLPAGPMLLLHVFCDSFLYVPDETTGSCRLRPKLFTRLAPTTSHLARLARLVPAVASLPDVCAVRAMFFFLKKRVKENAGPPMGALWGRGLQAWPSQVAFKSSHPFPT